MRIVAKTTTTLQIASLFVLPVLLLISGMIPLWYRFITLGTVIVAVIGIMVKERWTMRDAGMRIDNFMNALFPYTLFTIIALAGLFFYAAMFKVLPRHPVISYEKALLMAIPLSIGQEFIFRSFLLPKLMQIIQSPSAAIVINAIIFMFLHILYPNPFMLLPLAFIAGLGFATIYRLYPSLLLLSLSHAVLNYATALMGFFILTS